MPDSGREYREGGWGWVVVFAAFLMQFILYGNLKAGGVLITKMSVEFETDLWVIGLIDSLYYCVMFALSPIPVVISTRIGVRYVVVIGGLLSSLGFVLAARSGSILVLAVAMIVIAGSGAACVKETTFSQMALYFHEKYALASFVAKAGAPLGMMVYGPMTQALMDSYGWRGALMVLGAFAFHLTACGFLIRRPLRTCNKFCYRKISSDVRRSFGFGDADEQIPNENDNNIYCCSQLIREMRLDIFKDTRFLSMTAIKFFSGYSFTGTIIYMVPNALSLGIEERLASFTTTAWGVGNFLGMSSTAVVLYYGALHGCAVMAIWTCLAAVGYVLDPHISSFPGQIAITTVLGAAMESVFLVPIIMTRYLTTSDQVVFLYSWQNFISGLSYPLAGLVSGLLYAATGDFQVTFLAFSGSMGLTLICIVTLYVTYTKLSKRENYNPL